MKPLVASKDLLTPQFGPAKQPNPVWQLGDAASPRIQLKFNLIQGLSWQLNYLQYRHGDACRLVRHGDPCRKCRATQSVLRFAGHW